MTDAPPPADGPVAPNPAADPAAGHAYQAPHTETLLRQAIDMIDAARPMPLSASSMINKEEVLAVLQQAVGGLPDELRAARWLLKERDEVRAKAEREGEDIVAAARARAEQLVQRTEVVKAAEHRARTIVEQADDQARRMRLETEDWCDQKLGAMEVVLQKTLRTVESGRQRMQGVSSPAEALGPADDDEPANDEGFFDQDAG